MFQQTNHLAEDPRCDYPPGGPETPNTSSVSAQSITASESDLTTCIHRWCGIVPIAGFLGAERIVKRLCGVRGYDDATASGRRASP